METEGWMKGMADVCTSFQMDLSCLVDGELDDGAAGRAMVHMEACECCRSFFEYARNAVSVCVR